MTHTRTEVTWRGTVTVGSHRRAIILGDDEERARENLAHWRAENPGRICVAHRIETTTTITEEDW